MDFEDTFTSLNELSRVGQGRVRNRYTWVLGFPGGTSGQEPDWKCRCKSCRFNLWVGKSPWMRTRQPTLVFLYGESHGQRSLELTWLKRLSMHACTQTCTLGLYWEVGPDPLSKTNKCLDASARSWAGNHECHQQPVGAFRVRISAGSRLHCKDVPYSEADLPVLSELQTIVSFFLPNGPCLIHTEIVKGSLGLTETMLSGTLTAWVPLNSKTWSLSWPLSVGRPIVQFQEPPGEGSSSAVPDAAPEATQWRLLCTVRWTHVG